MVDMRHVEAKLKQAGIRIGFWGRPEIRELQHILLPTEDIVNVVYGRYEGGFATLVATDQRLLLIDKKPLYLTVEDVRYDMISEVDYSSRLMDATVCILTVNKKLNFKSYHHKVLRAITSFIQQRVMELRQAYQQTDQSQAAVVTPQIGLPMTMTAQFDPHRVGAAAMKAVPLVGPNPYTKLPLMMRRRSYGFSHRS